MTSDRSFRIQETLKERLTEVFFIATTIYWTHEHITEECVKRVWNSEELRRAPNYVRSYLQGYADAKRAEHIKKLVWMKSVDGMLLTTSDVNALTQWESLSWDKLELTPWQRVDESLSRHVYVSCQGEGILVNKPYDQKFIGMKAIPFDPPWKDYQ